MIENYSEEDLALVIYPHSVLVSDVVKAKELYKEFSESKFIIYISAYSIEPNESYTVSSIIIDIYDKCPPSRRQINVKTLNDQEYLDFISSINIVFEKYNKNILNFPHNEQYTLKEFLEVTNNWIETAIKSDVNYESNQE